MHSRKIYKKIAELFDDQNTAQLSRAVDGVIIFTIILTIVSIILESEPALNKSFKPIFLSIEYFSLIIFTVEYVCRLWTAPLNENPHGLTPARARIQYILSFHAIIDLLAILPFVLSFFAIDLRFLRVIRLLRIFKLTRYNSAMNTLISVIKLEYKALLSVIFVIIIILIISSSCIYLIEHKAQPEQFGSILKSMWWAIVTLATVGYGDAAPITPLGKLFGGAIIIVGIGLVALPAGLLASAFSEQLHRNKSDYIKAIKYALEDGIITAEEHKMLKRLQDKYDIRDEDATNLIHQQLQELTQKTIAQVQNHSHKHQCPHCGEHFVD